MKRILHRFILAITFAFLATGVFVGLVRAYPSGWLLPMYNEGRAVISNGPGEGQHTGVDTQAIDYFSPGDNWYTNRNVHASNAGTVKVSQWDSCAGNILGIEQADLKASLYYHLSSDSVSPGNIVTRGQNVADWGGTGTCADGDHLHFVARQSVDWAHPLSSGTPIVVSDLRGTGWYAWWPLDTHMSGYVVQSTSHILDQCSTDRTIDVRWPPISWVVGGGDIDGYSWSWTTSSSSTPDTTKEAEEGTTSTTSSSLSNGSWYFHLRVKDNLNGGEWASSSEVAHLGPFSIQSQCPQTK
jgi:hypothetical protein